MSRKLTTYTQPSITERLASAASIEELARLWGALGRRAAAGQIEADEKTLQRWLAACWLRVDGLILEAPTAAEAGYVFDFVRRWPKPPGVPAALAATLARRVAALPDDVAALRAAGVVFEEASA